MSLLAGTQTGCIVTTYLINTCSERSRTIVLTSNHVRSSSKTTFKVWTYRSNKDQEHIFTGRTNPHLCTRSDQQRTNIKRGTAFVGRNKTLIHLHYCEYSFFETFCGQFCHHNTTTGRLQASGILFQTENTNFTIFTTECFQSFECLLTIMQTGSCHVHIDQFTTTDFEFSPLTFPEINSHIVICLHVSE